MTEAHGVRGSTPRIPTLNNKMSEHYLAVLSRFSHLEGYLDLALEDLVRTGKAHFGFDESGKHFMVILHDKEGNPYVLFNSNNLELVKMEFKKRIIQSEGVLRISSGEQLYDVLEMGIHKDIQEIYTPDKLYTFCID